jgi:phage gpG-like protein
VDRVGKKTKGKLGSNKVYAAIHEMGGTIVPKTKKMLAIPTKYARGRRPADFQNTFVLQAYGKAIIMQKTGKTDRSIRPLFVLKRSVTIPKRPFLKPALEYIVPQLMENISHAIAGK